MLEKFFHIARRRFDGQAQRVPHQGNICSVPNAFNQSRLRVLLDFHLFIEFVQDALDASVLDLFRDDRFVADLRIRDLHDPKQV